MFEYYLPNKNEGATVAPKSKFCELNKSLGAIWHRYRREKILNKNSYM